MRTSKLLAAALACCTALTSFAGTAFAADDAAPALTFDIQCAGSNSITLTADALDEGNVPLDVSIYVPSNPGVAGINLKLQVNDGEVGENGEFGNYGFYLESGAFASPYCFDSENSGDATKSFQALANPEQMNFSWVYSQTLDANADAAAEKGTTSWSSDVSWAYENALLNLTVVVPQGTEPGVYKLDIRRDKYLNVRSIGAEKEVYGQTACISAESDTAIDYVSIPLTIEVQAAATTTETTTTTTETTTTTTTAETTATTETTTTSETTTSESAPETTTTVSSETTVTLPTTTSESAPETTTLSETTTLGEVETTTLSETTTLGDVETTTLSETTTVSEPETTDTLPTTVSELETTDTVPTETTTSETQPTGEPWEDSYDGMAEGFYLVLGDVAGKPGEQVSFPVMVYNDPGTAGMQLYFVTTDGLAFTRYKAGPANNQAYVVSATTNKKTDYPLSYFFTTADGKNAPTPNNGAILTYIVFTIPEDAEDGKVYHVDFYTPDNASALDKANPFSQISDENSKIYTDVSFFGGTVTVNANAETRLNYTSYSFTGAGQHLNLTLFNAVGDVTWKSSNEEAATVDQNGYVTSTGMGSAVITATAGGKDYTCAINVGLYGDINRSGRVDSADANLILVYFNMTLLDVDPEDRNLSEEEAKIADVNLDGSVDAGDGNFVLAYFNLWSILDEDISWYELTKAEGTPTDLAPESSR